MVKDIDPVTYSILLQILTDEIKHEDDLQAVNGRHRFASAQIFYLLNFILVVVPKSFIEETFNVPFNESCT